MTGLCRHDYFAVKHNVRNGQGPGSMNQGFEPFCPIKAAARKQANIIFTFV
jgi:hypothetical protein